MTNISDEERPCSCVPRCEPKTEVVEGIEFRVPVWCKTPQPWNSFGSWLDDKELQDRIKASLMTVSDLDALHQVLNGPEPIRGDCQTFWGSHGCSLDEGHSGKWHICDFDEVCMAVEELGTTSLIAWDITAAREASEPWPMRWERY